MRPKRYVGLPMFFGAAIAAVWLAGCGPGDGGAGPGEGADASTGNGEDRPDAASVGQVGDDCTRASQCQGELVCDPATGQCADEVPCADHDDCGLGSHCDDGGQCAESGDTSPCAADDNCAVGDTCIGGFCGCAGEVFEAELVDVNMLILLDRSGSMRRDLDGDAVGVTEPDSRWQIARGALDSVLDIYVDQLNLGFALYPIGSGCTPGEVFVDVSEDTTKDDILAALDDNVAEAGSYTPSGPSLEAMAEHDPLHDPDTENLILYITDGEENCGPGGDSSDPLPDEDQITAAGNLLAQGIRTFVVGFSDDIGVDELNATAEAAGTAREDPDDGLSFYLATDGATLEAALETIAGEALACTYDLSAVPNDPDSLHVYADRQSLIRDPDRTSGWDYDPDQNQITIHGSACDELRGGEVEELAIVQTCESLID